MKALCIFLLYMLAWIVAAMIIRGGLDGFDEHTWPSILAGALSGVYIHYISIDKKRKKSKRNNRFVHGRDL